MTCLGEMATFMPGKKTKNTKHTIRCTNRIY